MNAARSFSLIYAGSLIACLCLLTVPAQAVSEDLVDEELAFMEIEDVFTAAKHLQSIQDAPASVTVITDDDILKYGHRNLTDVVKNVRSFYTYSDRNYDYIGARGFARLGDYGYRVLQLVDGHTINDSLYGGFLLGETFGVDMEAVKKIEFVRGPGSALYGSNALLGTVNIITKTGRDIDGVYTKAEARSYNTYAGGLLYGKEFENEVDLIFSLSLLDSKGQDHYYAEFDSPSTSNGWARNTDGEKARKFFLKAGYRDFSFLINISWREKTTPTAAYGAVFNDNRFKSVDEYAFAEIKWAHDFDKGASMMTRVYYDRYRFLGDYPIDYPPIAINKDDALDQRIGTEMNYAHKMGSSLFLIGGEAVHHLNADQKNYDEDPPYTYIEDNRSFTTWSSYVQGEMDIGLKYRLIGGVRYDHYSTFGEHLSPRAGVIIKPVKESVIKLLYGQAFRAPTVYELYYHYESPESTYKANPNLKPEILTTYEAIWEQELSSVLKSTVSAFRYEMKDLITQVENPDGSLQFQNTDRVKSDGIELSLEITWPDVLKGHISYTRQEAENDLTGQWLVNSPRHLAKAGVIFPISGDQYHLGVQCRYMSKRLNRDRESVGESIVADLTVSAQNVFKGLGLSFGVYNVFDEDYSDPVSSDHVQKVIRQDGRNWRLKIDYLF